MKEVIVKNMEKIEKSNVLEELSLEKNRYFVISAHREENIDNEEHFFSLMNAINEVAETYNMPVVYSIHPRSQKMIEKREFKFHPLVKQLRPFGFFDYNKLQKESFCVLSDSGTLSEESSMLKFPAVLIRTSTERPEVVDKGSIVIGGITERDVLQSIELVRGIWENGDVFSEPLDYEDDNVSIKVVKIIQGYSKIINEFVWRK
jgi:UDP-N-acetylglucosamine 2-epimerase